MPLAICLAPPLARATNKGRLTGAAAGRGGEGEADDSQYGKLARLHQEDGREHEPDAGSKHGQGRQKQTAKHEEPVPATYCG